MYCLCILYTFFVYILKACTIIKRNSFFLLLSKLLTQSSKWQSEIVSVYEPSVFVYSESDDQQQFVNTLGGLGCTQVGHQIVTCSTEISLAFVLRCWSILGSLLLATCVLQNCNGLSS